MASPIRSELSEYGQALLCVVVSTLCALILQGHVQTADLAMIQLLGIVLASARFSLRASITACLFAILAFDYLFVPPAFEITTSDIKSAPIFIGMLVVAAVISGLNQRVRQQEQQARADAFRSGSLFALTNELSRAHDAQQVTALTARHLEGLFAAEVTIALRTPEGTFGELVPDAATLALAERAFGRGEFVVERGVGKSSIWSPIAGTHATLGAIGLRVARSFGKESPQGFLFSACVNQLATSLERVQLSNAVRRTELEAESERLRSTLLSAVSHDLKTPLATILAAGTTLISRKAQLDSQATDALLSSIVSEAERLTRLIQNLLSIARLESPTIELRRSPEAIDEIVRAAIERFSTRYGSSQVRIEVESDLPLVSVEPLLTEQVITNLLENAVRYAGRDANISVAAVAAAGMLQLQVADDGPGIPEDEREKVFEKFYRGRGTSKADGGVGLGLTICRAIVRAHGGRIVACAREGGGTLVEFTLPLSAAEVNADVLRERQLTP
jgi:two-component system sensor histidine kinase KdpD